MGHINIHIPLVNEVLFFNVTLFNGQFLSIFIKLSLHSTIKLYDGYKIYYIRRSIMNNVKSQFEFCSTLFSIIGDTVITVSPSIIHMTTQFYMLYTELRSYALLNQICPCSLHTVYLRIIRIYNNKVETLIHFVSCCAIF